MPLEAIRYSFGKLEVLDQLLLPHQTRYIAVPDTEHGWRVIHNMQVRGAPAIAIVGCLSLAVELVSAPIADCDQLVAHVRRRLRHLVTARPTAVNLQKAAQVLTQLAETAAAQTDDVTQLRNRVIAAAEAMLENDVKDNRAIGRHGAEHILRTAGKGGAAVDKEGGTVGVLTHCNTGALATAGYGTALGVIRALHEQQRLERAFCTETRPYNQGSRLTSYELVQEGMPATLVCDSAAAALLRSGRVHAVVVGADRVASNGDTANKIGTYQLAIAAAHHAVPFYVAAPCTSIDPTLASGDLIPIEERPAKELLEVAGQRVAADGIEVWNPAFDVTPADLITGGIITEKGVVPAPDVARVLS